MSVSILTPELSPYEEKLLVQLLTSYAGYKMTDYEICHNLTDCTKNIILENSEKGALLSDEYRFLRGTTCYTNRKFIPTFSMDIVVALWNNIPIFVSDAVKALKNSATAEYTPPRYNINLTPSIREIEEFFSPLLAHPDQYALSFDIETCRDVCHIKTIGFAYTHDTAMVISFIDTYGIPLWSLNDEIYIWHIIAQIMASPVRKIGHNIQFDISVLLDSNRICVNNVWFDTMIAFHCIVLESASPADNDRPNDKQYQMRLNLGFVASIVLDVPAWKHTSAKHLSLYNAYDALNTYSIAMKLNLEIDKLNVRETFDLEMSCIEPATLMGLNGVLVDKNKQKELISIYEDKLSETKTQLDEILKSKQIEPINYSSSKQVQSLLYLSLGYPIQKKKTATGTYAETADEKALLTLIRDYKNPELQLILKYREYSKLLSTYLKFETDKDNKIYFSYNITGTDTGRWSSSDSIIKPYGIGNAQSIPVAAREMFIPPEGYSIIAADFSQAEAVFVAYFSNDVVLKKIFKDNKDVHILTASMMFGIPVEQLSKESPERVIGKLLRHAISYKVGAGVVATRLGCTTKEAKKNIELYYKAFPMLKHWQDKVCMEVNLKGELRTPFNRLRKFYDRKGDERDRSAIAYLPQSSVGDLLNKSLVKFYNLYGDKYTLLAQLHDAMYALYPDNELEEVKKALLECMTWRVPINGDILQLKVDFKSGKDMKNLKTC